MVISALFVLLQAAQVPRFPAQVQAVGVTVSATDVRTGVPVRDLKQEDFVVLEKLRDVGEWKRQEIQHFKREAVPASVVILLDTSASMQALLPSVRDAASQLIRSLRPVDEVHVATFDDHYRILCDFTTDHEMAASSLADIQQGSHTALNVALYTATRLLERRYERDVERRRIIILLSDGQNTRGSLSSEVAEDTIRRSPVVCYIVHLRQVMPMDPRAQLLVERAQAFMQSIAYETGGQILSVLAPYDPRVIVGAFSGIAAELGSQYHLVYASSTDPTKLGWRSIGVAMTSKSGVRLRFRRGYYVPTRR